MRSRARLVFVKARYKCSVVLYCIVFCDLHQLPSSGMYFLMNIQIKYSSNALATRRMAHTCNSGMAKRFVREGHLVFIKDGADRAIESQIKLQNVSLLFGSRAYF